MDFLADIYLFAGFVCSLLGLKSLAKRLKRKSDALLETSKLSFTRFDAIRKHELIKLDAKRKQREKSV